MRLQLGKQLRDPAVFGLAIASKLGGCDLVRLRVQDVAQEQHVLARAGVVPRETGPVHSGSS